MAQNQGNPWQENGPVGDGPGGMASGGSSSFYQTATQGARADSGMAVGGWVPFANYLNTQSNPVFGQQELRNPGPGPVSDPGGPGGPGSSGPGLVGGPGGPGSRGPGLVGGPGPAGYYGQLSQDYLTGKRQ